MPHLLFISFLTERSKPPEKKLYGYSSGISNEISVLMIFMENRIRISGAIPRTWILRCWQRRTLCEKGSSFELMRVEVYGTSRRRFARFEQRHGSIFLFDSSRRTVKKSLSILDSRQFQNGLVKIFQWIHFCSAILLGAFLHDSFHEFKSSWACSEYLFLVCCFTVHETVALQFFKMFDQICFRY